MSAHKKGAIIMLIATVFWSIGGIFIKLVTWNPFMITGARSIVAGAVVLIYMKARGIKLKVTKGSVKIGIITCFVIFLFVIATKMTTSANAIAIQNIAPILILLYTGIVKKTRLKPMEITVVAITFVGIVLFFFDSLEMGAMIGNIVAVLSGFFYAGMYISTAEAKDEETKMSGLALAHIFNVILGCTIGLIVGVPEMSPKNILWIVILGVVQLGIPYILCVLATSLAKPLTLSLIAMLEPILNPIWVALFYHEVPGMWALIGAVIVIGMVVIYNIWESKQVKD